MRGRSSALNAIVSQAVSAHGTSPTNEQAIENVRQFDKRRNCPGKPVPEHCAARNTKTRRKTRDVPRTPDMSAEAPKHRPDEHPTSPQGQWTSRRRGADCTECPQHRRSRCVATSCSLSPVSDGGRRLPDVHVRA
jgi:hypothetical protein